MSKRQEDLAEFMNIRCNENKYTYKDVAIIETGYKRYLLEQKKLGIKSGRTQKDFDKNNEELAKYLYYKYTPDQLKFYKKCVHLMFGNR